MRKVAERIEPGCACAALHAGPYGLHMLEICSLGTGLFFSGSALDLLGGKEEEEQDAVAACARKSWKLYRNTIKIKMLTRPAWNSGACEPAVLGVRMSIFSHLHFILY